MTILKDTEIFHYNKMIGYFMNYFEPYIKASKKHNIKYNWEEDVAEIKVLKYHCSWDWLMPVVEKIETTTWKFPLNLNELTLKRNLSFANVFIFQSFDSRIEFIGWSVFLELEGTGLRFGSYEKSQSKIEATYFAVVEFIKWYNENKKYNE